MRTTFTRRLVRHVAPVLLVGVSLVSGPAAAAEGPEYSGTYSACMDKAAGVTASMVECIGVELQRQDRRLNAAYGQLLETLTPQRRRQLQSVQRLWLQYRDANCRFQADPNGGTIARVAGSACHLEMTTDRASELERLMPQR